MYGKTDIGDVFWINFMHLYTDGHMLVCCVNWCDMVSVIARVRNKRVR